MYTEITAENYIMETNIVNFCRKVFYKLHTNCWIVPLWYDDYNIGRDDMLIFSKVGISVVEKGIDLKEELKKRGIIKPMAPSEDATEIEKNKYNRELGIYKKAMYNIIHEDIYNSKIKGIEFTDMVISTYGLNFDSNNKVIAYGFNISIDNNEVA